MIRIVSDSSTLYSSSEAEVAGFSLAPLSVSVSGENYREFDEISTEELVALIRQGNMPVSSQPAIGEVLAIFEAYPHDEILDISMARGLSGTYDSAVIAANLCENSDQITVVNSHTLCGAHRYLVEKALELVRAGFGVRDILKELEERIRSVKSFLIPEDYAYLRRGGRLSPTVSYVGQAAGLLPIMTQTEDGTRLTIAGIRRGFPHALKLISGAFTKRGVGKGWRIYISHADAKEKAEQALSHLKALIPDAIYEILPLGPAFVTQGGPGCVAVQAIRE